MGSAGAPVATARRAADALQRAALLLALLGLSGVLALLTETFLTWSNVVNVLRQASINLVIAVGMTFVILSGGLDLSAGALVALVSVVTGLLMLKLSIATGIAAGLLVGVAAGLAVGALVAYGRVAPFIATLGAMTIHRGLALIVTDGDIITGLPEPFAWLGSGFVGPIPAPVVVAAAVVALGYLLLTQTPFGVNVYAIGGNVEAARLSGIDVRGTLLRIYALMGLLTAIAGIVMTARVRSGQPTLGQGFELDAIASVIIGGSNLRGEGSMTGTVVGALLIGVLRNGLNLLQINYFWQQVAIGLVIIFAVLLDSLKRKS